MSNFIKKISLFVLASFAFANAAAIIFEDDFSDPLASHGKWTPSLAAHVNGGSCALSNNSTQYGETYTHNLGVIKPSTFTLSFILKPGLSGDAGMFFCKASTGFNSYYITIRGDTLVARKYIDGNSTSNDVLHYKKSFDINKTGDNLITVSKTGSKFHLFVNDRFQGEFIDNQFPSGDIAILLFPNSSAAFGPVSMTNEFKDDRPNSFSENFTDNNLKYWQFVPYIESVKPGLSVYQQAGLDVKVNSNSPLGMYIDVNSSEFEVSVDVNHSGGSLTSSYGIILVGEGTSFPMIHFGIRGDRKFYITGEKGPQGPTENLAINGHVDIPGGVPVLDNLVVKKSAESSNFEFIVNGTTLSNIPADGFKLAGIGLFSDRTKEPELMNLLFFNFSAEWENTVTSISWKPNQRPAIGHKPFIPNNGHTFYDLRGRKRFTIGQQPLSRGARTQSAGMYLNEQGREIRVRKTPQK